MSTKRPRQTSEELPGVEFGGSSLRDEQTRMSIADLFPYQEIFLRVLSFLSPTELVHVQGVNKYWAKMSLDPQVSIHRFLSGGSMLSVCSIAEHILLRHYAASSGNGYIFVSPYILRRNALVGRELIR